MGYEGWAIFMDCDMLCMTDINRLWSLRDENKRYYVLNIIISQIQRQNFLEKQTKYHKKTGAH